MRANILVTGAAGYIGGSIVADFLASDDPLIKNARISAAVRSEEQAQALSKLGINVLRLDLADEKAVTESVLRHEINIVIQTASSIDPKFSLPLVSALSKQREVSGEDTYFIHSSGLSAFYEKTGWPQGEFSDAGPVFDTEKQLADSFPIRKTDVAITEHAKAQGVKSFIVVPSLVYGRGTGEWNKLSVVLPVYVKASIANKAVHKFEGNKSVSGVHISDLTALYGRVVDKILRKEPLPSGTEGYYFALAHDVYFGEMLDHLGVALKARGIATDSKVQIWPSDEAAAEAFGVPVQFVQPLWNSGGTLVTENSYKIGWQPAWNKERFLQSIDAEIEDVLELGEAKSSLLNSLHEHAKG